MKVVELDAEGWATAADFTDALKAAIGAPKWHGSSIDAFLDSMVHHDDINALNSPYTIKIIGVTKAGLAAQEAIRDLSRLVNELGASERGTDLEVTIQIEAVGD